jgi:DNA-binding response OmpR family regulator
MREDPMAEPQHLQSQFDTGDQAEERAGTQGVVLLIEDAGIASSTLVRTLEDNGFEVQRAQAGEADVAATLRRTHDLVLLALHEGSGADLCRAIRARSDLPVIIVSPCGGESDRVSGLESGADDYVCMPYSPREVAARVSAVLRRTRPPVARTVKLQDVDIRVPEHEVVVDGRRVELTAREFDVLKYLAERAGQVVTRERLLQDVWGMEFPGGTRTVDVHIAQVRRKLGRPGVIRTVRGVGYKALHFPGQAERSDAGEPEAAAS